MARPGSMNGAPVAETMRGLRLSPQHRVSSEDEHEMPGPMGERVARLEEKVDGVAARQDRDFNQITERMDKAEEAAAESRHRVNNKLMEIGGQIAALSRDLSAPPPAPIPIHVSAPEEEGAVIRISWSTVKSLIPWALAALATMAAGTLKYFGGAPHLPPH